MNKTFLAQKIRLYPNKEQEGFFIKSCGVARFAYNWALERWQYLYEHRLKPNERIINQEFNTVKSLRFPWVMEVSKTVPQQAIKDLGTAFRNFFRQVKKGEKPGYPRFKKKGLHDSFRPDDGSSSTKPALQVVGDKVRIPKLGWVRMAEPLRFTNCKIIGSRISRTADKWFISFQIEIDGTDLPYFGENQAKSKSIGIDLGLETFATLSDGTKILGPNSLDKHLKKLRRLNKSLSRKVKGSKNWHKARIKLARLYYRIKCIKDDFLHKLSNYLIRNFDFIAIEDLNVSGMSKNRCLSRRILQQGWSEFVRQLQYKAEWYHKIIYKVDRFFPSTKLCMNCGQIHEIPLSKRTFKCDCGVEEDRDVHAAMNILREAISNVKSVEMGALA